MGILRIDHIYIESKTIAFKRPIAIASTILKEKEVYFLHVESGSCHICAECAPLEGYSFENAKKAQHDLKRFKEALDGKFFPTESKALYDFLNQHLDGCCASARFAFEAALYQMAAQSHEISLLTFLGGQLKVFESVGLLQGSSAEILRLLKDYWERGYRIFKLKIGDRNIPLDVIKVRDVRSMLPEGGYIRLDANRAWSLKEAQLFTQMIDSSHIQFIEEPLSQPAHLPEFYELTHWPIALDETLTTSRCDVVAPGRCQPTLANHDAIAFYVLKPSLLGGINVTLDWIAQAKRLGKKVVLSAMYETEIGLKVLRELSHLTDESPGLGTADWCV